MTTYIDMDERRALYKGRDPALVYSRELDELVIYHLRLDDGQTAAVHRSRVELLTQAEFRIAQARSRLRSAGKRSLATEKRWITTMPARIMWLQ